MAKSEVILRGYSFCDVLHIDRMDKIAEHERGEGYMYYVKNVFRNYNDMAEFTVYAFKIVRETECFYFLSNKQRIQKQKSYSHMKISQSPQEALTKAIRRANMYLGILMQRAREVEALLRRVDARNSKHVLQDLRTFEAFAAGVNDVDTINPQMLRALKLSHDGMLELELIPGFRSEIPY